MDRERTWPLIGGHLALDLCNTVAWRLAPERRVDRIATPGEFAAWFGAARGRDHEGCGVRELHQVRALRDALVQLLDAQVDGRCLDEAAPARTVVLDAWRSALAIARPGSQLPLSLTIESGGRTDVHHFLALAAGDLVRSEVVRRLRRCEGPGCGWFFLDTSRNHSRRWCDPDDCGNRSRVRAYSRRRRSASAAGPPAERSSGASRVSQSPVRPYVG